MAIYEITIGNCEGNHQKHFMFIKLEDDCITANEYGDLVLTEKGIEKCKKFWCTSYHNYCIHAVSKEEIERNQRELKEIIEVLTAKLKENELI